jgi:arginyl-tRNA--protein-N-Asp/Glu arginylyltransferase
MNYLHWDEKIITDFSEKNIIHLYESGYVFTRIGKGVMHQTRSLRIDLSKFELSSENRRILKKVSDMTLEPLALPLEKYDFSTGKMAKDFYDTKFGPGIMSAQKVKEMLTDISNSNFNVLLRYITKPDTTFFLDLSEGAEAIEHNRASWPTEKECLASKPEHVSKKNVVSGFVISYSNKDILHYSYPFYDLTDAPKDMGMSMMINTINYAKKNGLKYLYLGSLQRPTDTYKLQFARLEYFDGGVDGTQQWSDDMEKAKKMLIDLK